MEKMKKNPPKKISKSTSVKKLDAKKMVKKPARSKRVKPNPNHWIESRARLVKILEASGFVPEQCAVMITHRKKDARSI
ncbi:MAG: hypothetical protein J6W41_00870 [Alphaproteobacteria bacterium]|nr:hypothetical protein [Alphaproteobacteria bacterium]